MIDMLQSLCRDLAVLLAGGAAGWTAFFSFVIAPQAFRDLDPGRAKRFIRNAMKGGHGMLAALSAAAGGAALLAGGVVSGIVLLLAALLYLMARWTLAPRDDDRPPPGGKRKLDTARVVAASLTAGIMLLVLAGAGLAMAGL